MLKREQLLSEVMLNFQYKNLPSLLYIGYFIPCVISKLFYDVIALSPASCEMYLCKKKKSCGIISGLYKKKNDSIVATIPP